MSEPVIDEAKQWRRRRLKSGCQSVVLVIAGLALALFGWSWWSERQALERQEAHARQHFEPVLEKIEQAKAEPPSSGAYDLDKTVRVLHEIDAAIARGGSLEDYLDTMALQDYRGVPPDVLAARAEVLDVLFRLYARQVEAEDQAATWALVRHMGPVLNLLMVSELEVGGDAGLSIPLAGGGGSVQLAQAGIDKEGVQRVYDDWKAQEAEHGRLMREVMDLERELIDTLAAHAEVYHRTLEDWSRLCALRDRAYLAAHEGNWEAAASAARAAVEQAPQEREAHLLLALALIEGGLEDPEAPDEAEGLLEAYIQQHPDASAPAYLLRGVLHAERGDTKAARLDLEQAAATYPKQAELLQDMLDPYRARSRSFLRKSREGNLILALYKSSMLGAAWFSPDLQLARIAFEQGEVEAGRKKVMDHFARRRAQGQWDLIIRDLQFCEAFLQDDYHLILPERGWLDLEVEQSTFGSSLEVAVVNRSERRLHNASLVLCLHFTDMHPDDYEAFAPRTEPVLEPHDRTEFEDMEVELDLGGARKTVDEIATIRAVLVSNEGVSWVDTVSFKRDQARQLREERQRQRAERRWSPAARPEAEANRLVDLSLSSLDEGAALATSSDIGKDDVHIDLPYLFSVLAPVFRLQAEGRSLEPSSNRIEGGVIRVGFDDVANFDDGGPSVLMLQADTFLTELVLTWTRDPGTGAWQFQGATRSD
jgi:tetratricopeptide (TPR) repeat protein